jgi:hypothetical protein
MGEPDDAHENWRSQSRTERLTADRRHQLVGGIHAARVGWVERHLGQAGVACGYLAESTRNGYIHPGKAAIQSRIVLQRPVLQQQ